MSLLIVTITVVYLLGSFIFGLSAFYSYLSEISREPRYYSAYETLEYAKAVVFSFFLWPVVWWKMGEARKEKEGQAKSNNP